GKPPNNYSIVVGLRKGWSSWQNKGLPRAEVGETKGIKVRHLCAATLLLAILHQAATRKTLAAPSRRRL
ncbi:hypothetical protein A2U01_0112314, partial [Trifolium medium]|nr:hypothetical protein [Trifolium medium]